LCVVVSKIIQYKISDDITFSLNIFTIFPLFFCDNINHKQQMEQYPNGGDGGDDKNDTYFVFFVVVVVVGFCLLSIDTLEIVVSTKSLNDGMVNNKIIPLNNCHSHFILAPRNGYSLFFCFFFFAFYLRSKRLKCLHVTHFFYYTLHLLDDTLLLQFIIISWHLYRWLSGGCRFFSNFR
jgi:hypothetical protein